MERRSFLGLPLIGFLGSKRASVSSNDEQAPNMGYLIELLEDGDWAQHWHYLGVLSLALHITGPVFTYRARGHVLYEPFHNGIQRTDLSVFETAKFRSHWDVKVPEAILPYFRRQDRGQRFPSGIPYSERPPEICP